jgi:hypothetical protein
MLKLTRFSGNPILSPREEQGRETDGIFNHGALHAGGAIHFLEAEQA